MSERALLAESVEIGIVFSRGLITHSCEWSQYLGHERCWGKILFAQFSSLGVVWKLRSRIKLRELLWQKPRQKLNLQISRSNASSKAPGNSHSSVGLVHYSVELNALLHAKEITRPAEHQSPGHFDTKWQNFIKFGSNKKNDITSIVNNALPYFNISQQAELLPSFPLVFSFIFHLAK